MYTEANFQSNTDLGIHFFVFKFIKIFFFDNTSAIINFTALTDFLSPR